MIVPFFARSAATGLLLTGLQASIAFAYFRRRNEDGSITTLADPVIVETGGGRYEFEIDDDDLTLGSMIDYVVDLSAAASPRYLEGHVSEADLESDEPEQSVQVASSVVDLSLKRGDLEPVFERPLLDERGAPLRLADDATVQFRLRLVGGELLTVDAAAEVVKRWPARVRYEWEDGDTDTAGLYEAEFVIVEGPRTLPASTFYRIEILPSLAD